MTNSRQPTSIGGAVPVVGTSQAGGGDVTDALNVGVGAGWFKGKVGTILEFKSVLADLGVQITPGVDEVLIDAGGIVGVVRVSSTGRFRHPTIASAIAASAIGEVVLLGPGVYFESFTLAAGVPVIGSSPQLTTIFGAAATGTRIAAAGTGILFGVNVLLPDDAVPAIDMTSSSFLFDVGLLSFGGAKPGSGIRFSGGASVLKRLRAIASPAAMIAVTGGTVAATEVSASGSAITTIVDISGGGAFSVNELRSEGTVTDVFRVADGTLEARDVDARGPGSVVNGLHITDNAADVLLRDFAMQPPAGILVDPALTCVGLRIWMDGGQMRREDLTAPAAFFDPDTPNNILLAFQDTVAGEAAQRVMSGDASFGDFRQGVATQLGEGPMHTVGFAAQNETPVAAFTDLTADLKSKSGSAVALLPGTAAGNSFYIGGDVAFTGFWANLTAALVPGAGTVVVELSDGVGGFFSVRHMSADAIAPHAQFADAIFERTGKEQIRFGDTTGWASDTVNGVVKFWARVRVTAAITTAPSGEQTKLQVNATRLDEDGVREHFGDARPEIRLVVPGLWSQQNGNGAGNRVVDWSVNIAEDAKENLFANGALDAIDQPILVPIGLDTSTPLTMRIGWAQGGAGAGDVEWVVRYATIQAGDLVDGSIADTAIANVFTSSGVVDELQEVFFAIPIDTCLPNDRLVLQIYRDARAANDPPDTLPALVYTTDITVSGRAWRVEQ